MNRRGFLRGWMIIPAYALVMGGFLAAKRHAEPLRDEVRIVGDVLIDGAFTTQSISASGG